MKNLEPGRELDALIAEKVMGLHKYVDANPGKVWRTLGDDKEHPCKVCGIFYGHGFKSYSTNISAAWEVVEKLQRSGFCCLKLVMDYDYQYEFQITKEFNDNKNPEHKPDFVGWSDVSATHAICLAALKAVEK